MGICEETAFIACDLCMKFKCHEKRCLDKICCEGSESRMNSERSCAKEALATKSMIPPLTAISLTDVSLSSRMLPPRVANQTVLCLAASSKILDGKKTDDELLKIHNEERKQVAQCIHK